MKDNHTCGPIGFARIRNKLQNEKPDKAEPSKAELFMETRKRKEGHHYKDANSSTQQKIAKIGELSSGVENNELVDEIIGEGSSHGREFLVGRLGHIKKAKENSESTSDVKNFSISEEALEQIKMEVREEVKNEIREEVKNEIKEEVRNEVTEEVSAHFKLMLERFTLLNPSFNLNLDGIATMPTTDAQSTHSEE